MKTVPEKHTHLSLPVELRFKAIPTTWEAGPNRAGERTLFPAVSQNHKKRLATLNDPEDIRKQFFKMGDDEESVLDFLNGVGVWLAVQDARDVQEIEDVRTRAMFFKRTAGRTDFNWRAGVLTPEYLLSERNYWRGLLLDTSRSKLRAAFDPKSPDTHGLFLAMCNTLQVHMEWKDGHPRAVIQPVTGTELLTALAWRDLIQEHEGKVCRKCMNPYTLGGSRFCDALCERANTKRNSRRRAKRAEAIVRENPDVSVRALLAKLDEAGIKRTRDWVVEAKAREKSRS